MEEDIKVLEEMIRIYKQNESNNNYSDYYIWKCKHERQAIENLINRNKTLEKEIKLMKSVNLEDNYIPKSKIRDKIKELEAVSISEDIYYEDILKMFQELLQEGSDK